MLKSVKRECLNCVKQDNIPRLLEIAKNEGWRHFDLNYLINGTYLLAEVKSIEMLIILFRFRGNLYQKLPNGKRILYQMRKNLISLLKEKKEIIRHSNLEIIDSMTSLSDINGKIKKMKTVILLFNKICDISKKTTCFSYDKEEEYPEDWWEVPNSLKMVLRGNYFSERRYEDKKWLSNLAYAIYRSWGHYYAQKGRLTQESLVNTGFYPKNIQKNKKIIKASKKLSQQFLLNENGDIYLLFRGTIQKNDPCLPLSHFGTKEAASYRLYCLNNALFMEEGEFYEKVKKNGWKIHNQMYAVFLKMKRFLRLPDFSSHDTYSYAKVVFHYCLAKKYGFSYLNKLYNIPLPSIHDWGLFCIHNEFFQKSDTISLLKQENLPKEFDFIFHQPLRMDIKEVEKELVWGGMYPLVKSEKNEEENSAIRENLIYQRMIRFFQSEGFDGFKYKNEIEDKGADSFIIFHPNQVFYASELNNEQFKEKTNPNEDILRKHEASYLNKCQSIKLTEEKIKKLAYPYFICSFENENFKKKQIAKAKAGSFHEKTQREKE